MGDSEYGAAVPVVSIEPSSLLKSCLKRAQTNVRLPPWPGDLDWRAEEPDVLGAVKRAVDADCRTTQSRVSLGGTS